MRKTLIIPLLVIAAFFLNACMPILDPAASESPAPPQPTPMVIETASEVPRISVDEAKQHFDSGTAIFVDSRDADQYEFKHIVGAIHLNETSIPASDGALPKDQLIITYCT